MKRGFLDLLDPSNDPEFFWQVISGPPCIPTYCDIKNYLGQRWLCIGKRPSQLISYDDFFGTNCKVWEKIKIKLLTDFP
jgi:hypothetical protein